MNVDFTAQRQHLTKCDVHCIFYVNFVPDFLLGFDREGRDVCDGPGVTGRFLVFVGSNREFFDRVVGAFFSFECGGEKCLIWPITLLLGGSGNVMSGPSQFDVVWMIYLISTVFLRICCIYWPLTC